MAQQTLLEKLEKLVITDRSLSFDNKNAKLYYSRATQLQRLGLNSLALYDLRICAFLEQRDNLEYYVENYQQLFDKQVLVEQFKSENKTYYFSVYVYLLFNDNAFNQEKIDPFYYVSRSGDLMNLGLFNLSLRDCNDAIKYLENHPEEYAIACLNKSMLLNLVGDYEKGWELYEKRWETNYKSFKSPLNLPRPKWLGEDIGSNTLLIHSEQGIGDNIQFVRYAILLKQQGINILVWNNEHIDDFLSFNLAQYDIKTVKQGDAVDFSHWVSMMSLPYLCHTTLEKIPFSSQYLTTSPIYLQKWENKLAKTPKLKVGVVWRGGSEIDTDNIRSIPLDLFAEIFEADVDFHCLQKDINESEANILAKYPNVQRWNNELESFFDTSALVELMDLVICVDTSVAHLSAAMGKKTWILITYKPDFRWLLERKDTPWYESVQLFRQKLDYDWRPVIRDVKTKLKG